MQQCMELTNTNRSRAYPNFEECRFVSDSVFRNQFLNVMKFIHTSVMNRISSGSVCFTDACLVAIAEGFHAYPSRTRPLSPPAPMVLGPKGPGRVGRRQAHEAIVEQSTMAFLCPIENSITITYGPISGTACAFCA